MAGRKRGKMQADAGGFRIDASGFVEFCEKLADKMGVSFGEVLEHETLKVLGTTAKKTKKTTLAKAGGKYNPRSRNFKGWVRMNGKFYYVGKTKGGKQGFRYSDAMWSQLMTRMAALRKRAEARVALSQSSYLAVATILNLKNYKSAFAGRMNTAFTKSGGMGSSGKNSPIWSKQMTASEKLKGTKPYIKFKITSTNTYNPYTKGYGTFQSAFNGREGFFKKALKNKWEATASDLAKAYPGISVGQA